MSDKIHTHTHLPIHPKPYPCRPPWNKTVMLISTLTRRMWRKRRGVINGCQPATEIRKQNTPLETNANEKESGRARETERE